MLLKAAVGLLIAWLVGVAGLYDLGRAVHVLFLAGLWLLFFGALKSRERAIQKASRAAHDDSHSRAR